MALVILPHRDDCAAADRGADKAVSIGALRPVLSARLAAGLPGAARWRACGVLRSEKPNSGFEPRFFRACHFVQSQLRTITAAAIPAIWAAMKAITPEGAMPANVSDSERAMVTAGLANEVDAVNQ